jgi:hypothetical protein
VVTDERRLAVQKVSPACARGALAPGAPAMSASAMERHLATAEKLGSAFAISAVRWPRWL